MDIQEIHSYKLKLQDDLSKLINNFQDVTGTFVSEICFEPSTKESMFIESSKNPIQEHISPHRLRVKVSI